MVKNLRNSKRMYAIQCSRCRKIMVPQSKAVKRENEQLIILDDLVKGWVLGKINIFPEVPDSVKRFIGESISGYIERQASDLMLGDINVCGCSCCAYGVVKCKCD